MKFFSRYGAQYAATLRLAIPVMLSQAGQVVVQLSDNVMVGRLGATQLAAVSFSNSVFFMVFILGLGLSLGITPLVGELRAHNDYRSQAAYLQNALMLYPVAGVIFCTVLFGMIPLMHRMGQPEEVVEMAIPYYRYVVCSVFPFMIFAAMKQFLEGLGNTKTAMYIVICCDSLNIVLNALLIYGLFGAPRMEAAGAGLATLVARSVMPIAMFVCLMRKNAYRHYFKMFNRAFFSWAKSLKLLKVGVPLSCQMFLEAATFCLSSIMMGWIGTIQIAADQIAITTANFAFLIVLGIGSAVTIRVSLQYGRRDFKALKMAASSAYHIGLLWNTFTALMFLIFRNQIPRLFTDDPELIAAAAPLVVLCGIFQISDGLQAVSTGILRGIQDVKRLIWISVLAYGVVNVPLGYFAAFTLDWGAQGIWFAYIIGLSLAAFMLNRRYRRAMRKLQ